ncbi:MAG: type II toxin-antitoxin system VapC family toxin [Chloroflexota bacterium]
MKTAVFVDTSAWYALADSGDVNHVRAISFLRGALTEHRNLVSTNHVIGESYTLILSRLGHAAAWGFLRSTRRSQRLMRIFVSEQLEAEAYALLERYPNQDFSFVDGTSFVAMKEHGVSDCFAFDRHFEAMGFRMLPATGLD